jgi:hypothetical protein
MRSTSSSDTIHPLVANISERRLRAVLADFLTALLACLTAPEQASEQAPPARDGRRHNGRRRRGNAATSLTRASASAEPRPRPQPAMAAAVAGADPRPRRSPTAAMAARPHPAAVPALRRCGCGSTPASSNRKSLGAVARELGVAKNVAQNAHRDGTMPPCDPRAAARFLTLTA